MAKGIANPIGIVALLGAMRFLGGFAYIMIKRESIENISLPLAACVTGFVLAAVGAILQEKLSKQAWITVNAECLDFEIQLGSTAQGGQLWALRALCRFELNGKGKLRTPIDSGTPTSAERHKDYKRVCHNKRPLQPDPGGFHSTQNFNGCPDWRHLVVVYAGDWVPGVKPRKGRLEFAAWCFAWLWKSYAYGDKQRTL
jgi:hypothetical protein